MSARKVGAADGEEPTPVPLSEVVADLAAERGSLARELAEIELLLKQATTESERHEQRRVQLVERVSQLEASRDADPSDLRAAREQLYGQTRRAALMASQLEVLEGKQRTLRRFEERLRRTVEVLAESDAAASSPSAAGATPSRAVMAAQEEMRREIARQMHDGPAQSIANIALQAEVVQRLIRRDPQTAEKELVALGAMVHSTLEATKRFIFEVRPMVLDDLGIVATLRRTARERAQRSGIPIRFESIGAAARLEPDVESNLFRLVDEALAAYVNGRPDEIGVRLSWTDDALETTVHSRLADAVADQSGVGTVDDPSQRAGDLPPALATMITDQRERAAAGAVARRQARGLPAPKWAQLRARADAMGLLATLEEEGRLLRMTASVPAR